MLTVLLPENDHSPALRQLLEPLLHLLGALQIVPERSSSLW